MYRRRFSEAQNQNYFPTFNLHPKWESQRHFLCCLYEVPPSLTLYVPVFPYTLILLWPIPVEMPYVRCVMMEFGCGHITITLCVALKFEIKEIPSHLFPDWILKKKMCLITRDTNISSSL